MLCEESQRWEGANVCYPADKASESLGALSESQDALAGFRVRRVARRIKHAQWPGLGLSEGAEPKLRFDFNERSSIKPQQLGSTD